MTYESAFFIEPKNVFGEIQPLLENNFSLFQIHRKKPYPLLNVMLDFQITSARGITVGYANTVEGSQK